MISCDFSVSRKYCVRALFSKNPMLQKIINFSYNEKHFLPFRIIRNRIFEVETTSSICSLDKVMKSISELPGRKLHNVESNIAIRRRQSSPPNTPCECFPLKHD